MARNIAMKQDVRACLECKRSAQSAAIDKATTPTQAYRVSDKTMKTPAVQSGARLNGLNLQKSRIDKTTNAYQR